MTTRAATLGTFVVTCVCATLGMMVALGFAVFHIYHRKNRIVKMSSPNINIVLSVGATLTSCTCFVYGLDIILEDSMAALSMLCQIRVWMIVCSLTLLLGPVLVKLWRIHQIFKYGAVKRVVIKDYRLMLMIACMLTVDILLLILWHTIDPLVAQHTQYHTETVDKGTGTSTRNETSVVRECVCGHLEVWLSVISVWKIAVALCTLRLAWRIRNVAIPAFNDSAYVVSAVFATLVVAFVTSVTAFSLHESPDAVYILTSLALATCGIMIQTILFIPKVYYWWIKPDTHPTELSATSLRELDATPTGNHVTCDVTDSPNPGDGLLDIVEENKQLKHSLFEREEFITALQGHLDVAKDKLTSLPKSATIRPFTGFETDNFSTVSNEDENTYDTLRPPERSPDRSDTYRIDSIARNDDVFLNDNEDRSAFHATNPNVKYSASFQSASSSAPSFVDEFTDIRNSIGEELTSAKCLSSDLRESWYRDLNRAYSETEWVYEGSQSKDLADSITQSYDLAENRETLTYLNSYIPRDNSIYQVKRSTRHNSASVVSVASSETYSHVSDLECGDVICDVTIPRDSATPDSHTHAAILRYYSYRHLNDGLQRFKHSYKYNSALNTHNRRNSRYDDAQSSNATFIEKDDINAVPNKPAGSACGTGRFVENRDKDGIEGGNPQPVSNRNVPVLPDSFV